VQKCSKCGQAVTFFTAKSGKQRFRCAPCDNTRRNNRYHEKEKVDPELVAARQQRYRERYETDAVFRAAEQLRLNRYLKTPEGKKARVECQQRYDASEKGKVRQQRAQDVHSFKYLARRAVSAAVKAGTIEKPRECQRCGLVVGRRRLQGHHHNGYDDAHRLDVIWLCRTCHAVVDKDGHGDQA